MNDFIRPSIYGAYHEILPVVKPTYEVRRPMQWDIVGPICESGDFLGKNRTMFMPHQGELFAVMGAGAYGFTMASNYNARPKVAELMVIKGGVYVVRRPQKYDDLVRDEFIPRALK
jgi:diaminopimelate decarboxylase